ncbi:MAG: hypothetical protein AAGG38_07335 [Planctomycetota bacterium]
MKLTVQDGGPHGLILCAGLTQAIEGVERLVISADEEGYEYADVRVRFYTDGQPRRRPDAGGQHQKGSNQ